MPFQVLSLREIDAPSCPLVSQIDLTNIGYCYTPSSFSSVEDKFLDLEKIHKSFQCSEEKEGSNILKKKETGFIDSTMSVSNLNGGVFRPRGALARTLYEKHQNDCNLRQINKAEWYRCNLSSMSENAKQRFVQLSPDEQTRGFISSSIEKSSWLWTQIWHCLAKSFLSFFMTRTDINGWLGRGSMFVLSTDQLSELLKAAGFKQENIEEGNAGHGRQGTLMDLGAGDGEVSQVWKELFSQLYATEMSRSMRKLLDGKGFIVLDAENWWLDDKFDIICMLNLLDRCSRPKSMLLNARHALKDDGLIIVALVLPFRPYVEYENDHQPSEYLPIDGKTFEEQVESFVEYAEQEIGLEFILWSKVPYLCEGDINQSYYWLNDALFIFKKNSSFRIV